MIKNSLKNKIKNYHAFLHNSSKTIVLQLKNTKISQISYIYKCLCV